MPSVTVPMARQTNTNIATVYPSTQTTVAVGGVEVLRRATELVADRMVSALAGITTLIDILRNTATNGDIAWNNLGSSSQVLTNRFLQIGMNAANTLLQELNSQLSVSANPSAVLQSFINVPNIDRFAIPQGTIDSILRNTPLANAGQVFFPNRVFSTVSQSDTTAATPIPSVSEVGSLNASGDNLPSVTTISTTRPGLNIPVSSVAGVESTTSNNQPESVATEVETFLENLANAENPQVTL